MSPSILASGMGERWGQSLKEAHGKESKLRSKARKESSYESFRRSQAVRSYRSRLEAKSWGNQNGDGRRSRRTQSSGFQSH